MCGQNHLSHFQAGINLEAVLHFLRLSFSFQGAVVNQPPLEYSAFHSPGKPWKPPYCWSCFA